jgi:hypothetical protein
MGETVNGRVKAVSESTSAVNIPVGRLAVNSADEYILRVNETDVIFVSLGRVGTDKVKALGTAYTLLPVGAVLEITT